MRLDGAVFPELRRPLTDHQREYWNVYFDLMENFKRALDANNIGIPFADGRASVSHRRRFRQGGITEGALAPFITTGTSPMASRPFLSRGSGAAAGLGERRTAAQAEA